MELNGIESGFLKKSLPELTEIGFVIEEFGRNFFRIEACPAWLQPEEAISYLRDFLEIASQSGGACQVEKYAKEAMIKLAIKNLGVKLSCTDTEIVRMANQLLACRNPYTCPQGRPIYYELPVRDFESRFRRKI